MSKTISALPFVVASHGGLGGDVRVEQIAYWWSKTPQVPNAVHKGIFNIGMTLVCVFFYHRSHFGVVTDNQAVCTQWGQGNMKRHSRKIKQKSQLLDNMEEWWDKLTGPLDLKKPGIIFVLSYSSWAQVSRQLLHASISWSTKWY